MQIIYNWFCSLYHFSEHILFILYSLNIQAIDTKKNIVHYIIYFIIFYSENKFTWHIGTKWIMGRYERRWCDDKFVYRYYLIILNFSRTYSVMMICMDRVVLDDGNQCQSVDCDGGVRRFSWLQRWNRARGRRCIRQRV